MTSFIQRELLDPHNVMEASFDTHAAQTPHSLQAPVPDQHGAPESVNFLKPGEIDAGTSIMGVAFDGGVVVGADSRVSTGVYISNRCSDKLTPIDERIYVCRSGSAADTQAITDNVRFFLDQHRMEYGRPPKVATAANFLAQLNYQNKDNLMAGMICGGWDEQKGGQVFALPIGGALLERPYATGGSGSTYIYGFCDAYYKPGMTKEQCEQFVVKALSHAMARDGSSGGVIRLAVIDASGVERKFIAGDKLPYGPL